ncbi:MAG: hypothetical protein PUP46_08460 [Endozoicomonas sp. (ex Botrylloides leachii)]|nr:hypothetical protein [Endozoicomonas sp. (ex Botrylloides leachii)]
MRASPVNASNIIVSDAKASVVHNKDVVFYKGLIAMKKYSFSNIPRYHDLKKCICNITCNSSIEEHISLELAISSNNHISEEEKVILLSSLFIVSLNKASYDPDYIVCRLNHLVIAPTTKKKLIAFIYPEVEKLRFSPQKTISEENPLALFKTKSVITYRR